MTTNGRRLLLLVAGSVLVLAIAIPVMGADPSSSASPPAQTKPDKADKSPKPGKADKAAKGDKADKAENGDEAEETAKAPEIAVTVTGTVAQTTDGQGRPTFTLTDGATTWELSAGPTWYWGDKNPLAASVGKSVTVAGTHREGGTEISVDTVDGVAIRAPGKPPWAGGPWVVGPTHPGWKAWMADGKPGKSKGGENAPVPSAQPSPGG
jgi:hypothetical protein